MAEQKRWKKRPENSTWGDYGADDQLGRMNELTPAKVKQGIAEVKEGKTFCLSMPLDYPGGNVLNPRRHPPQMPPLDARRQAQLALSARSGTSPASSTSSTTTSSSCTCSIRRSGTRWPMSARCSMPTARARPEPTFYNGYRGGIDLVGPSDAKDAGAVPGTFVEAKGTSSAQRARRREHGGQCLQGRGVMIDLFAHFGRKRHAVGYDDLMRVMAADGIEVEAGDFVLLRTGFDEVILEGNKKPDAQTLETSCTGLDGGDPRLQQWITESKLVALISDNYAVELMPTSLQARRLRHAAAAPALPVQDRRQSRRDLAPLRARRLAAQQQPQPLPADRAAAAAARRRRLAGDPGCDGVTAALRSAHLSSDASKAVKSAQRPHQREWRRHGGEPGILELPQWRAGAGPVAVRGRPILHGGARRGSAPRWSRSRTRSPAIPGAPSSPSPASDCLLLPDLQRQQEVGRPST